MDFSELTALAELSNELTNGDVKQIRNEIGIPEALCEDLSQVTKFLFAIKRWTGHKPFLFYLALKYVRPELIEKACKVQWLCNSSPDGTEFQQEEKLSIKTLIQLLKSEITKVQWQLIYMRVTSSETMENVSFADTLNLLMTKGMVKKDLSALSQILKVIQREDVVRKVVAYKNLFIQMDDGEFEKKFKRKLARLLPEMKQWEWNLKIFLPIQHSTVKQILGDIVEVFIELTILKEKPQKINFKDETTYNEIAYLRKIGNKEVTIQPVDFTKELTTYESNNPEIWCIIGNPGCGKTFLAIRTALRFSSNELTGIQYSISIPCLNEEWHSMEVARIQEDKKVDSVFIQKWICLGLPVGPSWTNDFAKHLNESSGDGVLFIIDGLDMFTRKVPFEKTFLFLLLTRQAMINSTIIITSRPGAWTDISSAHQLKVNRYYQVLGFSPANRDHYFAKQITNVTKLKECMSLMERHDEMKQLSLIPVNASLFAALLKGEDSTSINTLTKLYYELVLYMIRRELSRMGLKEYSRVSRISNFHTDILACLHRIGIIAILGVENRDLVSEETVTLNLGQEEYPCQCLGLAHEHYRKESVGLMKQVWTFVHLTMQEFVSALYLEHTSWIKQCYSVRYISHSEANFSLFRMVVRFLCGLLSDKAAALLSILYRYLTPQPIQLIDMPMSYQLMYTGLYHHEGWNLFTKIYFQLSSILFETNSDSIPFWFSNFKQHFPMPVYLYVRESVSPNEWICFVQTLKLVCRIQLIYIDTSHINPTQFHSLLLEMGICSIHLLALYFYEKDSTTVISFTEIIRETGMNCCTQISIELYSCNLIDHKSFPNSLRLDNTIYSNPFSQQLISHLTAFDILFLYPPDHDKFQTNHFDTLIPALCKATQLTGLHLYDVPIRLHDNIIRVFPRYLQLKEVGLDDYALLPALINFSQLTYLQIRDVNSEDKSMHINLQSVIKKNRDTLKGIKLYALHTIGFESWSIFLDYLKLCENLIQLVLENIMLSSDDVTLWEVAMHNLRYLVDLRLYNVTLYDTGVLSICQGLSYHPALRLLSILHCDNTSKSCKVLEYMIGSISKLEFLEVTDLSRPEEELIDHLISFADAFHIDHRLF